MTIHIKIIGTLLIVLALIHIIFPRYFKWKTELQSLSLINREMMMVHTFFIAVVVFLMGLLCLLSTEDLQHTILGKRLCFGLGFFWTLRFVIQFVGYSPRLWKGKTFETIIHIWFSVLWAYFSVVFSWIGLS